MPANKNEIVSPDKRVIVKISVSNTYANVEHFGVTRCVLGISGTPESFTSRPVYDIRE